MASFTIQDLVDRAVSISDMEGDFVRPAEWISFYNREARALDLFMLRSGHTQARPKSVEADPLMNYEIRDNASVAVLGVYEVLSGRYRPLKYQAPSEFHTEDFTVAGDAHFYTTEKEGDAIIVRLKPKPAAGRYLGLFYLDVGVQDDLADVVEWPWGVEERIVLGMARRALVKEESDTRAVEKLIVEEDLRIEELCWSHSFGDSPRVRNIDGRDRGWSSNMTYGNWTSWVWL